ncbi:DNA cytosine methyltransferase, partial [Salmonella enterica subsp. enterica serovar Carmel]|nr:DNA cytosine methyltransferase [Salmonella enterica subsp. enterica serovar Carmel]ECF4037021.1 DNA cytosine methyltransferase [Salmonella enterica subsp. enterica serovar Carmel]
EALAGSGSDSNASPVNSFWRDADWLFCRDGKWRPVKPGIKPLVNGTPGRVGQLRAYGNAIVAPVAETFIRAYMEAVTP